MAELVVADAALPAPVNPPKGGARAIVLAVLLLTVLAILLGGGIGYLMSNTIEKNVLRKEEAAEAARRTSPPQSYTGDIALVKLEPITTNLMSPENVFIRVEVSLLVGGGVAADRSRIAQLSAEISQDILAFLRTVSVAQLQGPSGLQNLREDLNDRANIRSEGKVRELILETMVVQ